MLMSDVYRHLASDTAKFMHSANVMMLWWPGKEHSSSVATLAHHCLRLLRTCSLYVFSWSEHFYILPIVNPLFFPSPLSYCSPNKEWSRSQCFPLECLGSPSWNPSLFPSCSSSWSLGQVATSSFCCSILNKTTILLPHQTPSLCGLPSDGGSLLFWSSCKSSRLSQSNGICPCRWDSPLSKSSGSDILKIFKICVFFAGKLFAAANFALVYIVTAELFPTYIRTTAIGRSRLISFRNPFLV